MRSTKQIEISTPGQGYGSTIMINGEQIRSVTKIEIEIAATDVNHLTVTKILRKDNGSIELHNLESTVLADLQIETEHGTIQVANPEDQGVVYLIQTFTFSGSLTLEGTLLRQEARVM